MRGIRALSLIALFLSAAASAAGLPSLQWDNLDLWNPKVRLAAEVDEVQMLARFERTPGIRILWWNIEGGNTNNRITTGGCPGYAFDHPLEHNLVALARSSISPDIIGMSEYGPTTLAGAAAQELERIYPYHFFIPYSPGAGEGIGVYSRIPLSQHAPENLAWEAGANATEKLANRKAWIDFFPNAAGFDRPYSRFEGTWQGKPFTFIPQHLNDPWPGIQKAKKERLPSWLKGAPLVGSLLTRACADGLTVKNIFFENDSPLTVQARELERLLERDFGPDVNASSVVVVGDLNAPTLSSVHRLLTSKLKDSFGPLTRSLPIGQASIPSNCAETSISIPPLKIDHALTSRRMNTPLSLVLKLHGSDHYPLLTVVEPK